MKQAVVIVSLLIIAVASIVSINSLSNILSEREDKKIRKLKTKTLAIMILSSIGMSLYLMYYAESNYNIVLFITLFISIFMIYFGLACILGVIKKIQDDKKRYKKAKRRKKNCNN